MREVTREQALTACDTLNRLKHEGRTTWFIRYSPEHVSEVVANTGDPTILTWPEAVSAARRLEASEAAQPEMPLGEAVALVCGHIAELGRIQRALLEACGKPAAPPPLAFRYRNYKGEVADRRAIPRGVRFAASEHHPEPQWLLDAYCLDRGAERSFALKDVLAVAGPDGDVGPAFGVPNLAGEVRKLLDRPGSLPASPAEDPPTFIGGAAAVDGADAGPCE